MCDSVWGNKFDELFIVALLASDVVSAKTNQRTTNPYADGQVWLNLVQHGLSASAGQADP